MLQFYHKKGKVQFYNIDNFGDIFIDNFGDIFGDIFIDSFGDMHFLKKRILGLVVTKP